MSIFRINLKLDETIKATLINGLINNCDINAINNNKYSKFTFEKSLLIIFLKDDVNPQVLHFNPISA